jgi:hypothetical protein
MIFIKKIHCCVLRDEMNKIRSHFHIFLKIYILTHRCFKYSPSICSSWIDHVFFYWVRFTSAQLTSSPHFSLIGVASPPADVVTPPRQVTLPSHRVKMSSLPPLHLSVTFRPVASPLEPKPKHLIRTTAAGHPPRTAWLPPFTAIKRSS